MAMLLPTPLILPDTPGTRGRGSGARRLARPLLRWPGSQAAAALHTVHCILWDPHAAAALVGPGEVGPGRVTPSAVLLPKLLSVLHLPISDKGLELKTVNPAFNDVAMGTVN